MMPSTRFDHISASHGELCVLVDASEKADWTMQSAADVFWQRIKNNDGKLSLERIANRKREHVHKFADRWLTLIIDGVQNASHASDLVAQHWEHWGIRVVVSCSPRVGMSLEAEAQGRAMVYCLGAFSEVELQEYLSKRCGDNWADIPRDVRDTLRRPLLAAIYSDMVPDGNWYPANEYELYNRYWKRLDEGESADFPLDSTGLKRAALTLLDDEPYPWTPEQLEHATLGNEAIHRLTRIGWLRSTGNSQFEVWHDRLLNWLVAEGLIASVKNNTFAIATLCDYLREMFHGHKSFGGRRLSYVPMDVVWLLAHRYSNDEDLLSQVVEALEDTPWPDPERLYDLLPTVGSHIVPVLFKRLAANASSDRFGLINRVVNAIAALHSPEVAETASALLDNASPFVQRVGMRVLAIRPSERALDRLWSLHCTIASSPKPFLRQHEHESGVSRECFDALKACVRQRPDWLERAVARANPSTQPVHELAWLLANLRDAAPLWRRCKPTLFEKVNKSKERCLAANIYVHRDRDELDWLLKRVDREDALVGSMAMRALCRLAPDLGVKHLRRVPKRELAWTGNWYFSELLVRRPTATRSQVLEILRGPSDPWDVAVVYKDNEDAMDVGTLALLLDSLEHLLTLELSTPSDGNRAPLLRPLSMLANIHRLELLACFAARKDGATEDKLTSWLLAMGPPGGVGVDRLERQPAMDVLYKFNGSGFTEVVNSWLQAEDRSGRLAGLQLAAKRANKETIGLLVHITESKQLWNDELPLEQKKATEALAALGQWDHVIQSILRWGLKTSSRATDHSAAGDSTFQLAIQPALDLMTQHNPTPGAVLCIGMTGEPDLLEAIHAVAVSAPPDSAIMRACLLALDRPGARSRKTEQLFAQQLSVRKHRDVAAIGLLHIATPTALGALQEFVSQNYDDLIVMNLARRKETQNAAAASLWKELQRSPRSGLADTLIDCLGCLRDVEVRDHLRRIAFNTDRATIWRGQRARAIRGLAQFDPESAFLAARKALQDSSEQDRIRYPYLLLELHAEQAVPVLLTQVVQESNPRVVNAIGRCLRNMDIQTTLARWLQASDESERVAACRLARWRPADEHLTRALLRLLDDVNDAVAEAARLALEETHRAKEAGLLVSSIQSEVGNSRRWILLDALLSIGDPGDEHETWPDWAQEVAECLPRHMVDYLLEKLGERRNKLADETGKPPK